MKKRIAKVLLLALALCAALAFSSCSNPEENSSGTAINENLIGFENSANASKEQGSLGQWADGQ